MPNKNQDPFLVEYGNSSTSRLTASVLLRWFEMCFIGKFDYIIIINTGNFHFSEFDVYFVRAKWDSESEFYKFIGRRFISLFMIIPIRR